jgi:uncharacterized protein (TIGR02679 family)
MALARPELAPLVDELARRFSEGDSPVSLALRDLPEEARRGLADVLGLDRLPQRNARVRLDRLMAALGLESASALRAAVESLRGPLPDRRAERLSSRTERELLWSWFADEARTLTLGDLGERASQTWVEGVRAQGARGGVDIQRARLASALRAVRALPADGVSLASFAADVAGDPHALDRGRRVSAIVLDAVALATGLPRAVDAETARQLWESAGVAPDPLSSTVLALGLDGVGTPEPLRSWLDAARASSEPVVLTLSQLRRWPLAPLPTDHFAYVVENPSLVAEAAGVGWNGPPLLCSSGRPTVAVVTLVRQLASRGGVVLQHADFDPVGLAITGWLAERAGTIPWRMTASDYLHAIASTSAGDGASLAAVPETPWDAPLADAMRAAGRRVYEEQLRSELFAAMTK